jgi:hypothetical protein
MTTLITLSLILNSIAMVLAAIAILKLSARSTQDDQDNAEETGHDSGSRNSMPAPSIVADLIRARARVKDTSDIYTLDNAHADIHEEDTGEYL